MIEFCYLDIKTKQENDTKFSEENIYDFFNFFKNSLVQITKIIQNKEDIVT